MAVESPVRAVVRAADILLAVGKVGPAPLAAICEHAGVSKATGHRLLRSFAHKQLVVQDPETGLYALGPGALIIADGMTRGSDGVGLISRSVLERLRDQTGETVALHTRIGTYRVCVAEVASLEPLRYIAGVGASIPVHSGSAGKVLLAFMPEDERRTLLQRLTLEPVTERTITDEGILEAELNVVSRRGYAISIGERIMGAAGMSVPIFDGSKRAFAALSVLGPEGRLTLPRIEEFVPLAQRAARDISDQVNLSAPRVVEGLDADQAS
jgi:DNA-binding IclR family transcriptional regulator